jgi:molybdenum cofactor cytidylyltransferase
MSKVNGFDNIAAIVLAAGNSSRMGRPKLSLPWGNTTVLGQVAVTFSKAGIKDIIVVTGGARELIEGLVNALASELPVRAVYNPDHVDGGMLSSIKVGLRAVDSGSSAVLIALGDQPQVQGKTINTICSTFFTTRASLVVPSFENQRGHPWLAERSIWGEILELPLSASAREFLSSHSDKVKYVSADETILQDLDTPEDYSKSMP